MLEGDPVLYSTGAAVRLGPATAGCPVGVVHAWRVAAGKRGLAGDGSPHRAAERGRRTFLCRESRPGPGELDLRDPRNRNLFFLLDRTEAGPPQAGAPVDAPTVSASMATAPLAYSGITLKMLVDQRLGAELHTMFMVDYEPGASRIPRSPFRGVVLDALGRSRGPRAGGRYTLRPGDVFWTGVGCVHAFYETKGRPRALARDIGAATPTPALLPLQPRLGLPAGAARRDRQSVSPAASGVYVRTPPGFTASGDVVLSPGARPSTRRSRPARCRPSRSLPGTGRRPGARTWHTR